ncbi:MAG TPA: primary-amine oxidase [Pseudolysinimonas sp.]|nr:primary-amine oxidase [Pseudolysinimonas sp.]
MNHHDPVAPAAHPLAPLTADEILRLRSIVVDTGEVDEHTRFGFVNLREPSKHEVYEGTPTPRRADVVTTSLRTLESVERVINLDTGAVERTRRFEHAVDGGGPMFDEEYLLGEQIVLADERFVAALAKRGVTDLSRVKVVVLSGGSYGYDDERKVRAGRGVAFWQEHPTDMVWAHPIDGIVAHVDLTNRTVLRVIETDIETVPMESGDYDDPAVIGPLRTTLKPISITQPEGVSFSLEGGSLAWEGWELRLGYNGREGLTIHDVRFRDGEELRPILYRAAIAEMVVNYGDPEVTHNWQNYFDTGESRFGRYANSLELGCDCVGEIRYVDAIVSDDLGNPTTIANAICVHEEDFGILWKHSDVYSGSQQTRRQRRLVVSFFVTVGNYDYGFYWYFYLDGTIELEAKATGIVFTSGHRGGDNPHNAELAPGVGAPIHQHLFSARLDMAVDGVANSIDEVEFHTGAADPEKNPVGNAIERRVRRLGSEREGIRDANGSASRTWRVTSAERVNRLGHPTAYVLHPEGKSNMLAAAGSSIARRAEFATHHLWVTPFDADEFYSAGLLVNQHAGGGGLPAYTAGDRSIVDTDIVLWHTFGLTHYPRLEDYPIMPVDRTGFKLTPDGFFDRNPTLNVPAPEGHCAVDEPGPHEHHDHHGHHHG